MVMCFCASTCSQSSVARLPIGVIFGPRSQPMTLAYIIASLIAADAALPSIDRAPTSTLGILFIIEERKDDRIPVPSVAAQRPRSASMFSTVVR